MSNAPRRNLLAEVLLAAFVTVITACQSAPPPADYTEFRSSQDPATVAARISETVGACWFGGGHPAFAAYSYTPELTSYSDRPRVLVVEKANPTGLPKLVIEVTEAERGARVKLFGPLMATAEASAISRDVERWAIGSVAC